MVEATNDIVEETQRRTPEEMAVSLAERKVIANNLTFSEADVGIQLFYSDIVAEKTELVQLNCAFKHRFSDFIVNEIDQEGEVVWFSPETDLQKWRSKNAEVVQPEEEVKEVDDALTAQSKSDGMSLYPETWTDLKEILSETDYTKFVNYVEGLKTGNVSKDTWLVFDEEFKEKERRASVHTFFKERVKLYEADTICKGESRKIQIFLKSSLSNNARKKMRMCERKPKDKSEPQYLKIAL